MDERGLSYLIRYYGYFEVEYSDICLELREISIWCGGVATVIVGVDFYIGC